jgi:hypothetical protein
VSRTLLVMAAVLVAGCGRTVIEGTGGQGADTLSGPVDPYGDPREYEGDPFAGYLAVHSIDVPGPAAPGDSVYTPAATGRWSIQVAACSTESAASRLVELAASDTGLEGHVDREGQWWKVRVGAWETMEEATSALGAVRTAGYADAWVVERLPGD